MIETHNATITGETEDFVYLTTDADETFVLRYWNLSETYGLGDEVELTVETFPQTGAVTAAYVLGEKA